MIRPNKIKFGKIVLYAVISCILLIQIYPILWIFMSSLKSAVEFRENSSYALPETLYFQNYVDLFSNNKMFIYYKNSIIITVAAILLIIVCSSFAGFALKKFRVKYARMILVFFLAGMMIPIQVTLIPLFQIYGNLGMTNTYLSVILPQVGFGLPVAIYLFAQFYEYLPNEVLEASVIDGCSIPKMFTSIVMPLSKNSAITVAVVNTIFVWNDFIFANTFISKEELKPLPLGLMDFIGDRGQTDWGMTFTAIAASVVPLMIFYFILNKKVIEGMAVGAVKG